MLCATDVLVFATSTHYLCLDFKTKRINELFARTEKHVRPLITQVSETEFLLSGPGALGIFVDSTGASQRPPVSLSSNLSSLFCQDSLIFAVDDEFVSIHSAKTQEQLQTLVVKNTSTACMSLDGKRLFLTSSQAVRFPQIYTVRSETWDMVARRLILAGCTTEAQDCVQRQYRRLLDLCAERPATSSTAKLLFTARSKRVFTLMGFYFFEFGRLEEAKQFFEKSSLNVCDLLYRYVDLLPRNYTFTPSSDLNVSIAVQAQVENTPISSPNTIFDLAETLASCSKDKDPALCVRKYRIFLLEFLLEHRRSRIFEKHTQFVETALFKLCILLQDYVSANLTSEFSLSTTYDSWEALISSFRNVDVKDLFTFLIEHRAHHAQALLCSWQGDLSTALDIWRRLAFGELDDPSFPGPNFYLNTLVTLLLKPLFFHGDSPSLLRAASPDQLPTAGQPVGSPVHADLVWQHLGSMLTSQQLGMADQLLVQLARLTLWRDVGMTAAGPSNEPPARPSEVGRLLPSFPLSPENLLCRLLPEFPVLAECYLWHRIFDAGDKVICGNGFGSVDPFSPSATVTDSQRFNSPGF
uniref:CNH domain-containing protein n=1 Tax=Schistocephalus solidus TaxID=70667 RepID=A0A0X3NMT7_SCHSO